MVTKVEESVKMRPLLVVDFCAFHVEQGFGALEWGKDV